MGIHVDEANNTLLILSTCQHHHPPKKIGMTFTVMTLSFRTDRSGQTV